MHIVFSIGKSNYPVSLKRFEDMLVNQSIIEDIQHISQVITGNLLFLCQKQPEHESECVIDTTLLQLNIWGFKPSEIENLFGCRNKFTNTPARGQVCNEIEYLFGANPLVAFALEK